MKRINSLLVIALSLFWLSSCQAPNSDEATTTNEKDISVKSSDNVYRVDTSASKLNWVATKVSGAHVGIVPIKSGELQVKDGIIASGSFTIDMKNLLVTGPKNSDAKGNIKLTGHLKSPDFFDADKYPESKFEITGIKTFEGTLKEEDDPRQEDISQYKVTNPTHTVSGNLTIKDITKNIEFPARITVTENSVDAVAKFNIDRRLWNINYPGQPNDLIRDMIHFGIAIKAVK